MISAHRLEPARAGDAAELARLSRDLIEHGLPWRWRTPQIARRQLDPESEVLVARDGEHIAGFALMEFRFPQREAHLLLLAVEPEQRRRGLGGELLAWLETLARAGGIEWVFLEVRATNRGARAFYRRLGYVELERVRGYYQGREDAICLRGDLRGRAGRRSG